MIAAIVPAKALDRAKGRLAALLTEEQRRALALAMLQDVLAALKATPRIALVAVVSPDDDVLALSRDAGAEAIPEPPSVRGINQALSHALDVISPRGPDALLVLLADVPGVTPADLDALLDALPASQGVVISPSHDKGTSALLMRPPGVIPFRFGPNSFPAHKRETVARRIPTEVVRLDALSRDIDSPDDLRAFASLAGDGATHRLLATLEPAVRVGR